MTAYRRVAFFPDTFYEINGVALTSREYLAFARRRGIPFLSVYGGPVNQVNHEGPLTTIQLQRGRMSFNLDVHLEYDPLLIRYGRQVVEQVRAFGAELVHITGPGDIGTLGWYVAHRLRLPMLMSWHTSLHEYGARRLERLLLPLGDRTRLAVGRWAERKSLDVLGWYYRHGRVLLAPNQELVDLMRTFSKVPALLMQRGVDTNLFTPGKRRRDTDTFRIGYVGRLTPEKNVRFLATLGQSLKSLGRTNLEFVIVGQGSEAEWLRGNVPNATLTGVLRGEALARAYADMDLFVFPSRTDTFGNVVLEALASGVPAVVTNEGGPKFLVQHGVTGYIATDDRALIKHVNGLLADSAQHTRMREAARRYACGISWDAVFEKVFQAYEHCFAAPHAGFTTLNPPRPDRLTA